MFKLVNPWMIVAYLLAIGVAGTIGYRTGAKVERADQAELQTAIAQAALAAQLAAADEISKIKIINQTHRQVLEREIINVPTGTCVLSPDGVRAINAILAPGSVPAGSGVVPSPDPAG